MGAFFVAKRSCRKKKETKKKENCRENEAFFTAQNAQNHALFGRMVTKLQHRT